MSAPADVGPSTRPLGVLALGASLVCLALALTVLLAPLAYVAALVAAPLGWAARAESSSRRLGLTALWLTGAGVVVATLGLVVVLAQG